MTDASIRVPFNRASVWGHELEYVSQAIARGHISGDGSFTRRCHEVLESALGVRRALLTTSCTHALELSALLLTVGPGDEVILPSFTFVSTVNAFVLRGAIPVFADIHPDTLNIDPEHVRRLVSDRTAAIVVVHYAGIACDMDAIDAIAAPRSIPVVEDNAHGLFGAYRGRPLGTLGRVATLSFHETKNFTCGEGGALLLNDDALIERAEILREKGTNRSRFFRGQVDKYTWVDVGSSYLPSDMLAAFLLGQLEARERIQAARARIWHRYADALDSWAAENDVTLPTVPGHCDQSFHLFYLVMPSPEARQGLITHLRARGILAVFHYLPLHLSEMGRRYGGVPGQCPVTERVSDRLVRLPFFSSMSEEDQREVIAAVRAYAPVESGA
jgi:dTDP-4-amino-4,6-dideoxygalactose transaminase